MVIDIARGTYSGPVSIASGVVLHGGWSRDFTERWDFLGNAGERPDPGYESIITGNRETRCKSIIDVEGVEIEGLTIREGTATLPDDNSEAAFS